MSYDLLTAKEYCVITFNSTQCALLGEKHLTEKSFDLIVIPTPREISASCGLALKLFCGDVEKVRRELTGAGINTGGYFLFEKTANGVNVSEVGVDNGQK